MAKVVLMYFMLEELDQRSNSGNTNNNNNKISFQ